MDEKDSSWCGYNFRLYELPVTTCRRSVSVLCACVKQDIGSLAALERVSGPQRMGAPYFLRTHPNTHGSEVRHAAIVSEPKLRLPSLLAVLVVQYASC